MEKSNQGSRYIDQGSPAEIDSGSSKKRPLKALVFLLLALLVGSLIGLLISKFASSERNVTAETDESSSEGSANTTIAPSEDELNTENLAEENTADPVNGDVTTLNLDLVAGDGDPDGSGVAKLEINSKTGEICYDYDSDTFDGPSRSHIHLGTLGVKGEIVVEMGLQESFPASGCVESDPREAQEIVSNLGAYYTELHSPNEENTIRAQLSDDPVKKEQESELVDVDGGGAITFLKEGEITLQGNVPDQVTMDRLLSDYENVDLGDTKLRNELEIVAGSPAPSGLIEVADSILFDFDSAKVIAFEGTVLEDLAKLFKAQPDWEVDIVGHTDSKGRDAYNLELSLRRAEAIREALESAGVRSDTLSIRGAGDRFPIVGNDTDAGRSKNRRIEFQINPGE